MVAERHRLEPALILRQDRRPDVVYARNIAAWLLREKLRLTFEGIGGVLGDRHHSTVIHSVRLVNQRRFYDRSFNRHLDSLWEEVLSA